jgi:hypothetical protein
MKDPFTEWQNGNQFPDGQSFIEGAGITNVHMETYYNPLHESMQRFFDECMRISVAKNHDYAGGSDPLANFSCLEPDVNTGVGILVRMSDKWARIKRLMFRKGKVQDEKLLDTFHDLANYTAILAYYLYEVEHEDEKKTTVAEFNKRCDEILREYELPTPPEPNRSSTRAFSMFEEPLPPINVQKTKAMLEAAYVDPPKVKSAVEEAIERGDI